MNTQTTGLALITGASSGVGAAATDLWKKADKRVELLPRQIVMPAEDMVDAALSSLDRGEFVTIPALPNAGQWQAYEATRQVLRNLSHRRPADKYAMIRRGGATKC